MLDQRDARAARTPAGIGGKPLTYLACPYSHPIPEVMEWRYEQATKAAAWLITNKSWNVFSPITHSHPLHKLGGCRGDWRFWEQIDYEYLSCSNRLVVLLVDGWKESVGVTAELQIARELGIEVWFFTLAEGLSGFLKTTEGVPKLVEKMTMRIPIATPTSTQSCSAVWSGANLHDCHLKMPEETTGEMRTFETGATRTSDKGKPDYEGFLSPLALAEFGAYMLSHQEQADGNIRPSDNWQKGIPLPDYMKSLWRHLMAAWTLHRGFPVPNDEQGRPVTLKTALAAVVFNAQGYLHELIKAERK